MKETHCEAPGCTMPGTVCYTCQECLCWHHKYKSSCESCHKLIPQGSFEQRLSRCLGIGASLFLAGLLFLFLPHDEITIIFQLAIAMLIAGSVLIWFGLIAHLSLQE